MYAEILAQLGLAKNEARIYETLLREGELSVGSIAVKSKVHRRNVYDSLHRLTEKGLVFEIIEKNENRYQAVEPQKLMELMREKEQMLSNIMPELEKMYQEKAHIDAVYVYRGAEGWKNYLSDILRIGEPAYFIGAKGGWMDERIKHFFPQFAKEAARKKIPFYHLFDYEVKKQLPAIFAHVGPRYRFLPKGYSTPVAVDIVGDHIYIISGMKLGGLQDEFSLTVIVNQKTADAFRMWFKMMWDFCGKK